MILHSSMVCGKKSLQYTDKRLKGTSVHEQNSASKRDDVGLGQFLDTRLVLLLTGKQSIFLLLYKSYSIERCLVM
uniref:Putative ovule protein n=1 Tax=Solanum chacoense TaxID=4108 RepID=A0A0V0GR94_SOLCH